MTEHAALDAPSHLPPQSLEAEEAILGAMMVSPIAAQIALDLNLQADDFYRPSHRTIFDAVVELHRKGVSDELTTVHHLKAAGKLGEVGGAAAVMTLAERVPAVANARAYAQEVIDQSMLRGAVSTGHEIARLAYEHQTSPNDIIEEAGRLVDRLSQSAARGESGMTTLADQLHPYYDAMSDRAELGVQMRGLSTGLKDIDAIIGGAQPGKLIVIAGRPGMGKSSVGAGWAESFVFGSGVDVMSVNLEMLPDEQAGRTISRIGSVNLHRIANAVPTDKDFEDSYATIQRIHDAARRFHMDESTDLTVDQIRQRARRLNRRLEKKGRRLDALLIDYMQKIAPPRGMRLDSTTAAVTYNSGQLKALALELDIPVIVLSQLNRSVEERPDKRPRMSDLRDSGAIEQDADVIVFLYRPEYYLKDDTPNEWRGRALADVAKVRNGRPDEVTLRWEGQFTRYSDNADVFVAGMPGGMG